METMNTPGMSLFQSVLNHPVILRIRHNHGLEHATLHMLAQRYPRRRLAGHADASGFWLLGNVSTEDVRAAVEEALQRMRAGEHNLAVHPNCGTNLVITAILAGLAAFVGMFGAGRRFRDKLERLPLVISMAMMALILAQPLGNFFQARVTTSGHLEALEVVKIFPARFGLATGHRILTRG